MEEINLKDFFSYLKRYILGFILVTLVAMTGVLAYDLLIKTPVYQASTTVVIAKADNTNNATATLNDVNTSQKLVTTYSEIAKSELVLSQVISDLWLDVNVKDLSQSVTVTPVEDTSILRIQVKDPDAVTASVIANSIAKVFMKEIAEIYKLDNVSQLSVAGVPETVANNTLTRDLVLAAVLSILGVAGLAFLRFYLDDTVKHNDDVEKELGLAVAGKISKNDLKKTDKGEELLVEKFPKAMVSENIKSLRTNLQFTAIDKDTKTILVTSTNAGEGKSFVAANLAISFAQADKRVLLVDCDLRKGRAHRLFKIPNTRGLSNLLTDYLENLNGYVNMTDVRGLDVITCGTYPPNPSELLSSQKNRQLVEMLRSMYDIVILDGAPVNGLADSVILAGMVDETLLVTRDGGTAKSDLAAAKDALSKVGARVAGVVFNFVNRKHSKYYYYEANE